MDVLHQRTLLNLHQRVNPRDQVVGWWTTGAHVRAIDVILQVNTGIIYGYFQCIENVGDEGNILLVKL